MTLHTHDESLGGYDNPLTMVTPGKKIGEISIGPNTELHTDQEFLDSGVVDKYRKKHRVRAKDGTVSVVKDEVGRAWVHNGHHRALLQPELRDAPSPLTCGTHRASTS